MTFVKRKAIKQKLRKKLKLDGHTIEITSQEKLYFPESGLTKGAIVDYYRRIAPVMLPYLHDRPITMHRFPNGIAEEGFYQQHISDYFPDWIERATVTKENGEPITHVLINNAATLVYLANQGMITPHIWLSRIDKPTRPDRMIFDLDPSGESAGWVREAAVTVHDLLESLGLSSFVMTSGSKGFHVVVPLDRRQDFDSVREFAQNVAVVLVQREPDRFTVEHRKDKRGDRILVDTLRNTYAHTAVAPYALRARPSAPIATPIRWNEMYRPEIHPQRYTPQNIFRRLGVAYHDPWHDIEEYRQSLSAARNRLKALTT
ncbi:MAG: ATP-dependent DNA ligase [Chloroflexi bacterium]|nr:MAG: ATP-dependent DNA ligase [Chloroflexota bacterium]